MSTLGTPIAAGRTAEIYPWGEDCILKLIRPGFGPHLADQEWYYSRTAWQMGARAPQPMELLDVEDRHGVVLQRIDGRTMIADLERNIFRLDSHARLLAQLHAEVLALSVPTFPSQSERVRTNLSHSEYLSDEQKQALLQLVDSLPESDNFIHGDFHPVNIILAKGGPCIIDWESSMHGSPAADVANTVLWIRAGFNFDPKLGGRTKRWLGHHFERAYLAEFERVFPGQLDYLDDWIALHAACRLRPDTIHELPLPAPDD